MILYNQIKIKSNKSMSIIDKMCQKLHFNDKISTLIDILRFRDSPRYIFEPLLMK